jgi:hypothetical protein
MPQKACSAGKFGKLVFAQIMQQWLPVFADLGQNVLSPLTVYSPVT